MILAVSLWNQLQLALFAFIILLASLCDGRLLLEEDKDSKFLIGPTEQEILDQITKELLMLKTLEKNRNGRLLEDLDENSSREQPALEEEIDVHKEYDEVISEDEKADL